MAAWAVRERGRWEQVQGISLDELPRPLLPWLQLLWGLFEFRRRTPEREERHRCAPWSEIVPGVEF